jgi:hypothetical protein
MLPPNLTLSFVRIIIFGCCALFTSCSLIVKTAVNKKLPQRSLDQIRARNLEEQTLSMERLVRADVGVHLAATQLDSAIDANCTEWFKGKPNFDVPEIDYVTLKKQEIGYDKQSIKVDLLVDIVFKKDQKPGRFVKSSTWRLQSIISPRAQDSTMIITASVVNVKIEKLKLRGIFQLLWIVKPVFNSLAVTLRDNINGYLEKNPIVIPLKIKPLPAVKIRDIVSSGQLQVVGDPEIRVNKKFGPVAIKVDERGIDMIAQMVDVTEPEPAVFSRPVSETAEESSQVLDKTYRNELALTEYHVKKTLDNMSHAQPYFETESRYSGSTTQWSAGKISKSEIPSFAMESHRLEMMTGKSISEEKGLFSNPRRKKSRRLLKQEVPKGERRNSFDELFSVYSDLFNSKMIVTLDSFRYDDKTEVQLSKQFITAVFNGVFADPQIAFTYTADFNFNQPPVTIELMDKPKFNCSSVLENCSNRLRNCNSVLSDCGSCSRWNVLCHAKRAACHAYNGVKWGICQVGNGATYAACQVENGAKFAWCSTVFLVKYALYEALKIGTYSASVNAHIDGNFGLVQASLAEKFDSYSLTTNVHGRGNFDARLLFDGAGVTEWFLCQGIDCRLRNSFTISQVNPVISGNLLTNHIPGSSDQLVINVPEIKIALELDNPLITSLLTQCPGMFVSCKVSRILAFSFVLYLIDNPTLRSYLDVLWKGRYNHSIDPFDVKLDIPAMRLPGTWGVAYASVRNRSVSLLFNP